MTKVIRALDQKPAARVEQYLFRVRWLLLLVAIPIALIDRTGDSFPVSMQVWLVLVAVGNGIIGLALHYSSFPEMKLAVASFAFDIVAFGVLPHLMSTTANLLAFFLIYPALVGAVRFGPHIGLIVAGLLALPIELRALVPWFGQQSWNALSSGLPVAALLSATALAGYLAQHERESALKHAATELEDLRRAMAGARLLYQTADALSSTTSYSPVLDAMLEAGIRGMPATRREDGSAVGMVLLFEQDDALLHVVAWRHLDRRDVEIKIEGKKGIIAEALQSGNGIVFDNVGDDPELACYSTLARCHSGVCYPLQAGLEQYGIVVLATPAPRRPSDQHLELMRAFTSQAALAFQNAKLYQNLRVEHDQILRNENEMRQKLARDLHDGPTQRVAALVMQLDYIERLLDKDPAEAKAEIIKARETAQQTVKEIRTSLFTLRPLALETKGLSAALEQYCERVREAENVPITIEPGNFGQELDSNVAATVFSIIDEAVNNARKHAAGSPILVRVMRQGTALVATISDQGPGFDIDQVLSVYSEGSSMGLQNMKERAHLIDAELRIDSQPGGGTRVTLFVRHPERVKTVLEVGAK